MRKSAAKKRHIEGDPRYNDTMVTSFVNNLMWQGKKAGAFKIFYGAMDIIDKKDEDTNGYETWKKAITNITPALEVRSRRIGGATFQIPTEVRPARRLSVAMKWLIKYARERKGKSMAERMAAEIMAAAKNEGAAIKKKEDTHRMAEANKAFSHFRI